MRYAWPGLVLIWLGGALFGFGLHATLEDSKGLFIPKSELIRQ